jgi:hypothetical protein
MMAIGREACPPCPKTDGETSQTDTHGIGSQFGFSCAWCRSLD